MGCFAAPDGYPIKLVRDAIPQVINATRTPGDLFYGTLSPEEKLTWLHKKLGEEVTEYLVNPGVVELRDILAVVEGLAFEHGVNLTDLQQLNDEDPRGGFFEGIIMLGRHDEFDLAKNEEIRDGQ